MEIIIEDISQADRYRSVFSLFIQKNTNQIVTMLLMKQKKTDAIVTKMLTKQK
jgi:hypothetical protein